jgi:hypothetical protein
VDIEVLADDSDPDGDPLSILAISQGSQGSVEILPNGTLRYRPVPGALGSDSFQYSIGDGHGGTASATVTVTISTLGKPLVESFSPSSGWSATSSRWRAPPGRGERGEVRRRRGPSPCSP